MASFNVPPHARGHPCSVRVGAAAEQLLATGCGACGLQELRGERLARLLQQAARPGESGGRSYALATTYDQHNPIVCTTRRCCGRCGAVRSFPQGLARPFARALRSAFSRVGETLRSLGSARISRQQDAQILPVGLARRPALLRPVALRVRCSVRLGAHVSHTPRLASLDRGTRVLGRFRLRRESRVSYSGAIRTHAWDRALSLKNASPPPKVPRFSNLNLSSSHVQGRRGSAARRVHARLGSRDQLEPRDPRPRRPPSPLTRRASCFFFNSRKRERDAHARAPCGYYPRVLRAQKIPTRICRCSRPLVVGLRRRFGPVVVVGDFNATKTQAAEASDKSEDRSGRATPSVCSRALWRT